jgi:superfamily I DNA/RNA helicase
MEEVVSATFGEDGLVELRAKSQSPAAYEELLRNEVKEILREAPDTFRRFDYVFVDEIQDFDNFFLLVLQHLSRGNQYFFVGDAGQKIYDRSYNLAVIGLNSDQVELPATYRMHRTPKYIAELALKFLLDHPKTKSELERHGYRGPFGYANSLENAAEILRSDHSELEVAERVEHFLRSGYREEDVLVVASPEKVQAAAEAIARRGYHVKIGETVDSDAVIVTDFNNVKGLEREIVFVLGVDDLPHRGSGSAMFLGEEARVILERLSRRKVYVSLTRCLEHLTVFYQDRTNPFIRDLLKANEAIERKRLQRA